MLAVHKAAPDRPARERGHLHNVPQAPAAGRDVAADLQSDLQPAAGRDVAADLKSDLQPAAGRDVAEPCS